MLSKKQYRDIVLSFMQYSLHWTQVKPESIYYYSNNHALSLNYKYCNFA